MKAILVDTGPLVAFFNKRDAYHDWAVDRLSVIEPPLQTCEAVLTEAFFLLRKHRFGIDALLKMLERRIVTATFQLDEDRPRIGRLLRRYADTPMSLADACLVRMSELHADCELLTLDGDFRFYRRNGRQVIPLIVPPQNS